jgi:hypothetical protein
MKKSLAMKYIAFVPRHFASIIPEILNTANGLRDADYRGHGMDVDL